MGPAIERELNITQHQVISQVITINQQNFGSSLFQRRGGLFSPFYLLGVTMPSTVSPAPSDGTSKSPAKSILLAAAVFLVVAGGSFVFLRNPAPQAAAKSDSDQEPSRDDKKSQAALQHECLLENFGSVSSIYLYQSYLNVGLLADAVKNGAYTKDRAADLLSTIMTLLETVDAQMQKLDNIGLDEDETAAVGQIHKISELLQAQTESLQTHWKTGEKASLEKFNQARRESWNELRQILGLAASGNKG
jgi:hypothetical protein